MHTVGRWALRVPDGGDGPPNVPFWMDRLAVDLTDVAKDNQGTLGARPTSTALTPGIAGRYFTTTDELDGGVARRRLYRDAGAAWDEVATLPVTRRMVDSALGREVPTGLLTVAQFLALGAQPDGTVARVQLAEGRNVRLRANGASLSAHKWEADDGAKGLFAKVEPAATGSNSATPWSTATPLTLSIPLVGEWDFAFGFGAQIGLSQSAGASLSAKPQGGGIAVLGGAATAPPDSLTWLSGFATGASFSALYEFSRTCEYTLSGTLPLTITLQFTSANYAPALYHRWMAARPLRVTGPTIV